MSSSQAATYAFQVLQFAAFLALFVLELFADADADDGGQEVASFASVLTFSWMNGLFAKGYNVDRDLTMEDFPGNSGNN